MRSDEQTTSTTCLAEVAWGIIRYAAGSGRFPEEDAAAFAGWYASRADAVAIAKDWVRRHPQWIIALVRSDKTWFGDRDFSTVDYSPLTYRERKFQIGESM